MPRPFGIRRTPSGSTADETARDSNNVSGNNHADGAALNIRALAGVVVSGDQDSVLGWRQRTTGGGSFSMDGASDVGTSQVGGPSRGSFESRRNMSLQQLQKAIKSIMVSDSEMYAKLQAGLQGIGSLARETHQLTVNRDETGATCINQYVVVKTLGRGSYGKVKLCLNTLDGQLYAIKVRPHRRRRALPAHVGPCGVAAQLLLLLCRGALCTSAAVVLTHPSLRILVAWRS